jgi:hypothetical protein
MNISTPTTTTIPGSGIVAHHQHSIGSGESPFPNYREINLTGQSMSGGKRNAQSVEGKATSSETQEVYMSLDRKSAKKQFIEMSSAKRENNFSKIPTA